MSGKKEKVCLVLRLDKNAVECLDEGGSIAALVYEFEGLDCVS